MAEKEQRTASKRSHIPGSDGTLPKHRANIAAVGDQAKAEGMSDDDAKKLLASLMQGASQKSEIEVVVVLRRRPDTTEPPPVERFCRLKGKRPEFLSRSAYAARFGATKDDVERVFRFARQHGLAVIDDLGQVVESTAAPGFVLSCAARRMLRIRGAQKDMDQAFGIESRQVNVNGVLHRAHDDPASVPADLGDVIVWIFGLETHNVPQVGPHIATFVAHREVLEQMKIRPMNPADLATQYAFPEDLDGSGQCIGILQPNGGYSDADMRAFFKAAGVALPKIVARGVNDPGWYQGRGLSMFNMEVALDVQVAGALASGATIAVYMPGRCAAIADAFPKRLYEVLSAALYDEEYKPSVVTLSWGGPEAIWKQGDRAQIEALLADAACLGVTVCVSSGDAGIGPPDPHAGLQTPPACVYPASSPHVLACGGTALQDFDERTGLFATEVVWNDHSTILQIEFETSEGISESRNGGGSSGGGVSECYGVPSYQESAEVPEKSILYWKEGQVTVGEPIRGRGVPDVAANADIHTGYRIHFDGDTAMGGGTSSAAPLWAALIARLNCGLEQPVGFINPALYRMQLDEGRAVCRDITSGNNGGYEARRGWNPCTGLGSPNGEAMLAALRAAQGVEG